MRAEHPRALPATEPAATRADTRSPSTTCHIWCRRCWRGTCC